MRRSPRMKLGKIRPPEIWKTPCSNCCATVLPCNRMISSRNCAGSVQAKASRRRSHLPLSRPDIPNHSVRDYLSKQESLSRQVAGGILNWHTKQPSTAPGRGAKREGPPAVCSPASKTPPPLHPRRLQPPH